MADDCRALARTGDARHPWLYCKQGHVRGNAERALIVAGRIVSLMREHPEAQPRRLPNMAGPVRAVMGAALSAAGGDDLRTLI